MDPLRTIFYLKRCCAAVFCVAQNVVTVIKSHLSTVAILLYCTFSVNETCKHGPSIFEMDVTVEGGETSWLVEINAPLKLT